MAAPTHFVKKSIGFLIPVSPSSYRSSPISKRVVCTVRYQIEEGLHSTQRTTFVTFETLILLNFLPALHISVQVLEV